MSEPYLGQVRIFAFNYAPKGWAFCDGQLIPASQNPALYSLLGLTFGGGSHDDFALPDLRGRAVVHPGTGKDSSGRVLTYRRQGEGGGAERNDSVAGHTHDILGSVTPEIPLGNGKGTQQSAVNGYLADGSCDVSAVVQRVSISGPVNFYTGTKGQSTLKGNPVATTVEPAGDKTVNNMQPYVVVNYCIALTGIFPPRN